MATNWSYVRSSTGAGSTGTFSTNTRGDTIILGFISYGGIAPVTFPSTMTDSIGNTYNLLVQGYCVTYTQYTTYALYECINCLGSGETTLTLTDYVYLDSSPVDKGLVTVGLNSNGSVSSSQLTNKKISIPLTSEGILASYPVLNNASSLAPSGLYYVENVYNSAGQLVAGPDIAGVTTLPANTFTNPAPASVANYAFGVEYGPLTAVSVNQSFGPVETVGSIILPNPATKDNLAVGISLCVAGTCTTNSSATVRFNGSDHQYQDAIIPADGSYTQDFTFSGGVGNSCMLTELIGS